MDRATLLSFIRWCTLLNLCLLLFYALICGFAGDWIFALQRCWFDLPRETIDLALYLFLGIYKILWLTFNLMPWLALEIMARRRP